MHHGEGRLKRCFLLLLVCLPLLYTLLCVMNLHSQHLLQHSHAYILSHKCSVCFQAAFPGGCVAMHFSLLKRCHMSDEHRIWRNMLPESPGRQELVSAAVCGQVKSQRCNCYCPVTVSSWDTYPQNKYQAKQALKLLLVPEIVGGKGLVGAAVAVPLQCSAKTCRF